MISFLLAFFSFVLVLICFFLVLVVLMQKPSASSGVGASMGAGAVESAFGAQGQSVLSRATLYAITAFFVLAFALYLGMLKRGYGKHTRLQELPKLEGLATPRTAVNPPAPSAEAVSEQESDFP